MYAESLCRLSMRIRAAMKRPTLPCALLTCARRSLTRGILLLRIFTGWDRRLTRCRQFMPAHLVQLLHEAVQVRRMCAVIRHVVGHGKAAVLRKKVAWRNGLPVQLLEHNLGRAKCMQLQRGGEVGGGGRNKAHTHTPTCELAVRLWQQPAAAARVSATRASCTCEANVRASRWATQKCVQR